MEEVIRLATSNPSHGGIGRPTHEIAIDTSGTAEEPIVELSGVECDRLLAEYGRLYSHRSSVLERMALLEGGVESDAGWHDCHWRRQQR